MSVDELRLGLELIKSEDVIERSARVMSIAATGCVPVFRYTGAKI